MVRISSVILLALLAATDGSTDHGRMNDVYEEIAATPAGVLGKAEQLDSAEAQPVTYGRLRGSSHDDYTSALEQSSSKKLDVNEARAFDRTESFTLFHRFSRSNLGKKDKLTPQALLQKLTESKWACSFGGTDKYLISLRLVDQACLPDKSVCKVKGGITPLFKTSGKVMTTDDVECLMNFDWNPGCDVSVTDGQVTMEFTIPERSTSATPIAAVKGEITGDEMAMQLKLQTLRPQKEEEELFQCTSSKEREKGEIENRIDDNEDQGRQTAQLQSRVDGVGAQVNELDPQVNELDAQAKEMNSEIKAHVAASEALSTLNKN